MRELACFIGFPGDLESWINHLHGPSLRADVGIVADSDPFREAENNAAVLVRAIKLVESIHVTEGST